MKKLMITFSALFCSALIFAQAPTWSVSPQQYQYSMTMSAVAIKNCSLLGNTNNMIGAFIGNECRGVARTTSVVNGFYVASLVIYHSAPTASEVTFKVYDETANGVYDAEITVPFEENASIGYSTAPFEVYNQRAPYNVKLNNMSLPSTVPAGFLVGTLSSVNPGTQTGATYSLTAGAGDNDNHRFAINGNQLTTIETLPMASQSVYSIRVHVAGAVCSMDTVLVLNDATTGIASLNFKAGELQVFPNPAKDQFRITLDLKQTAMLELNVFDIMGKEVFHSRQQASGVYDEEISAEAWKPGIYMIKITIDGYTVTRKISIG